MRFPRRCGSTFTASTNLALGAAADDSGNWSGDVASLQVYSVGTSADPKINFDAMANRYRATPLTGIDGDNLVLHFDAANAVRGLNSNTDNTCDSNVIWTDLSTWENFRLGNKFPEK